VIEVVTYRFGKHPPENDYRTLRFKDYLTPQLPPPPESFDVLPLIYKNLNISDPTGLFPIDYNDRYGDCTIAAVAHAITVYSGLIGIKKIMDADDVKNLYFNLTDGIDSGLVGLNVINYWRKKAIDGDKIFAYAKIDYKNHTHVQQAIKLFGGVYTGFQVQEDCEKDFEARKPWTPGDLTNDGHMVFTTSYDATGVTVLTWGNTQKGTWDWWDECVDEAYAILPPEANNSNFSPGFDFDQLQADLEDIGEV
jgi:hypothetical protein